MYGVGDHLVKEIRSFYGDTSAFVCKNGCMRVVICIIGDLGLRLK